jgi:hypothetical protein
MVKKCLPTPTCTSASHSLLLLLLLLLLLAPSSHNHTHATNKSQTPNPKSVFNNKRTERALARVIHEVCAPEPFHRELGRVDPQLQGTADLISFRFVSFRFVHRLVGWSVRDCVCFVWFE